MVLQTWNGHEPEGVGQGEGWKEGGDEPELEKRDEPELEKRETEQLTCLERK